MGAETSSLETSARQKKKKERSALACGEKRGRFIEETSKKIILLTTFSYISLIRTAKQIT
jgi:hypothetical protein